MSFLRNAWYAAAFSDEVAPQALFHRIVLGEDILFYRPQSGGIAAVQNWCPHRFAPLHLGKLKGDTVECGYHGLAFDRSGACAANPQGPVPPAARLRSYPAEERHHLIWLWMGEAPADASLIPDYRFIDENPETARTQAYLRTAAHYELMTDNIMDLSHADYLHSSSLAAGMLSNLKPDVEQDGDDVIIRWIAPNVPPSKLNEAYLPPGTMLDIKTEIRWTAPANMCLSIVMMPHNGAKPISTTSYHIMTPESGTSTHYFHSGTRDFCVDDRNATAERIQLTMRAFVDEDKPMIEAVQRVMGDETDLLARRPIMLRGDGGVGRARRVLRQLIGREQGAPAR
jgi:phenylpropionate dioxygenase-like ring-hydroxylating dioxygenase large terminal subunit